MPKDNLDKELDPKGKEDTLDGVTNPDEEGTKTGEEKNDSALLMELGEMKAKYASIMEKLDSMAEERNVVNNQPEPIKELPPIEKITPDQINKALTDGEDVGSLVAKMVAAEKEELKRSYDQELNGIRSIGISTMEELSNSVTTQNMPHVKSGLLTKEYEAYLKTLPPEARMHPKVRMEAYYRVVGANEDKIMESKLQEINRKKEEDTVSDASSSTTKRDKQTSSGPLTARDIGGEGAVTALNHIGVPDDQYGRDSWAKKLGYENWDAYAKMAQEAGIWPKEQS